MRRIVALAALCEDRTGKQQDSRAALFRSHVEVLICAEPGANALCGAGSLPSGLMGAVRGLWSSPARFRVLLVLLAPALVFGIIAMHHLLSTAASTTPSAPSVAVASAGHGTEPADHLATSGTSTHGEGDEHSSMAQHCGGLLAACLALLLTVAGLLRWRHDRSWRVLWLRARPTRFSTGLVRDRLEHLTPLERTTVLRC